MGKNTAEHLEENGYLIFCLSFSFYNLDVKITPLLILNKLSEVLFKRKWNLKGI